MTTYTEMKARHRDEMNDFNGIFFAFSNEQFEEGMTKLGLTMSDTDKIFKLMAGGFILKERSKDFHAMIDRHEAERKELKKQEKSMLEALTYELKNHEYCITYDVTDALNALGWSKDEIDPKLLKKACAAALECVNA